MNYAFVTVLSTNNYYKGVIALFESIKMTNTKYPRFAVIVNENIYDYIINEFQERGYTVIKRDKISPESVSNSYYKHWNNTFDKFNIFGLEEYNKIIYLDADMYVTKNIDHLFKLPHMSAVVAGKSMNPSWNEINSGLMVIKPQKDIIQALISTLTNSEYDKEIGDKDIIEKHFNWKNQNLSIPENYNLFADYLDYYINELNYKKADIYVIHFVGPTKPWMLNKKEQDEYINKLIKENRINLMQYFTEYTKLIGSIGKKLSIITPYYNTLEYTKRLANILQPQLTDEVEWIIVDDGTNDVELDNLKARVIHLKENSGNASKPRNVGLDAAKGDFIAFIDSDDEISSNYIDTILNKINNDKFDYCYFSWKTKEDDYVIEDEPLEWNHSVWNCVYKKEIIGNERFNEKYNLGEDEHFNQRVRKGIKENITDILYIYHYQERENSLSSLYESGEIDFYQES